MKTYIIIILTGMIFIIAGCSNSVTPETEDIVMTQKSLQLIKADNSFTFNLFNKIPDSKGHNVMVSPLSI